MYHRCFPTYPSRVYPPRAVPPWMQVTVYVYQLVDGEVRVEKIDYTTGAAA